MAADGVGTTGTGWLTDRSWHTLDAASLPVELDTDGKGLSHAEAKSRLAAAGPNVIPTRPPTPIWKIALRQFKSPLIYLLAASAGLSIALGHARDAGFIAFVLAVNALIGTWQEGKAEKGSQALRKLLRVRTSAVRQGSKVGLDAEGLVPGDLVWIESGEKVPADLRLSDATGLEIDESLLTGESLAVAKEPSWRGDAAASIGDRLNMAYAGSTVRRGRATGLVVATGTRTALGRLAGSIAFAPDMPPPLVGRMQRFSVVLTFAVAAVCIFAAAFGVFVQGRPGSEMFFFAVALAVSAIPEGLPSAMAVALSVAVSRMARRGVLVRRLPAVEGLGSCTLIASDKTGTLTCNELTVREIRLPDGEIFQVEGEGYAPNGAVMAAAGAVEDRHARLESFAMAAALCNEGDLSRSGDAWTWRGDPTDIALLSMVRKLGWRRETWAEARPERFSIPFEAEQRFAATFRREGGRTRVFMKGAPEKILSMSIHSGTVQMAAAEAMAAKGYRVLAFATGLVDIADGEAPAAPSGLEFLGFTGMIDPLRPAARSAVAACRAAGVQVWMVTGDHPVTALAIARELGLAETPAQVRTGRELQELDDADFAKAAAGARVFARVSPEQKLQLVRAAAGLGHFVAVTGDGVNDAPALKAAHIGVAMGRDGTDVARDAAEIVLSDDDFASVVAGIEEGRIAYKNIRNVIAMQMATAVAEVVICGLGIALGLPLPLLPVQLLWLNLVTNGIQDVALAFEPGEGDELEDRPRPPEEPIFDRLMLERVLVAGGAMAAAGFGLFWFLLRHGHSAESARNLLLLYLVLFENVCIGIFRSERRSAFATVPWKSPMLLGGTLLATLIHIAAMHIPFMQKVLGTGPVDGMTWVALAALALTGLVASEAHKWVRRRIRSRTAITA